MKKEAFLKAKELEREIDLIYGLQSGKLESSGWIRVKRSSISQPEVYPQSHQIVTQMINDPDAIKVVISDEWNEKLNSLRMDLERQFDKL